MLNAKNGRLRLSKGEMDYIRFGTGSRVMVMIPGVGDGLKTVRGMALPFALMYRALAQDFTVYVFSRRVNLMPGETTRDMAADLSDAMAALGLSDAAVVGVSQGGMIAQYLAIDYPDLVDKLILAVTAPNANEVVKDAVGSWIQIAEQGDHVRLMVDTAERMYSKQYLEKNRKLFPLMARFTKPASYERFFRNACAILEFNACDELSRISCPTLIIAGSDDHTVGNEAPYTLHNGIPGSRMVIYQGLGHGAFEEAKDFYDQVFGFCSAQEP